jgi:hypothetical protein
VGIRADALTTIEATFLTTRVISIIEFHSWIRSGISATSSHPVPGSNISSPTKAQCLLSNLAFVLRGNCLSSWYVGTFARRCKLILPVGGRWCRAHHLVDPVAHVVHPRPDSGVLRLGTPVAPRSGSVQNIGSAARSADERPATIPLASVGDFPRTVDALRAQHVIGDHPTAVGGAAVRVAHDVHLRLLQHVRGGPSRGEGPPPSDEALLTVSDVLSWQACYPNAFIQGRCID